MRCIQSEFSAIFYTGENFHNMFAFFPHQALSNQNSTEGGVAPAGAKVTGATIRTWLLNKFISFLAVLSWKSDKN